MGNFTKEEQNRLDVIARKIADILWDEYPDRKGRHLWEGAYNCALGLVYQINHAGTSSNLLHEVKDFLFLITQKAPGYDWNADPLYLTLKIGGLCQKLDAASILQPLRDMSNGISGPNVKPKNTIKSDVPTAASGKSGNEIRKLNDSSCQRSFHALQEYMDTRTSQGVLEQGCDCHSEYFHSCDHCKKWQDLNLRMHQLMEIWGDNWATMLWSYQEEISHLMTFEAGRDSCNCGEGEACSYEHCSGYPRKVR